MGAQNVFTRLRTSGASGMINSQSTSATRYSVNGHATTNNAHRRIE
jgi:hypothetical protein